MKMVVEDRAKTLCEGVEKSRPRGGVFRVMSLSPATVAMPRIQHRNQLQQYDQLSQGNWIRNWIGSGPNVGDPRESPVALIGHLKSRTSSTCADASSPCPSEGPYSTRREASCPVPEGIEEGLIAWQTPSSVHHTKETARDTYHQHATHMSSAQWFNEPAVWHKEEDGSLVVRSLPGTDFWQKTYYGFVHDNGSFYYTEMKEDFTVDVKIVGKYKDLYDQAGLMMRLGADTWLKCGVEYVTGSKVVKAGGQQASVVVTRGGFSDWSAAGLTADPPATWFRATRQKDAITVSFSLDGEEFTVLRVAYLPPSIPLKVGPLVSSPEGEGFNATFSDYKATILES